MTRRPALSSRSPRALVVTAAAAAAFGLTGCAELSQQATTLEYDPADGVSANVGSVVLQDVMLVTSEGGDSAKLLGLADNPTSRPIQITVGTSAEGGQRFTVPARGMVRFDGKANGDSPDRIKPIELSGLTDKPGESTTLAFTSGPAGQVQVSVPVLLDQYPYGDATVTHPTAEGGEEGGGGH